MVVPYPLIVYPDLSGGEGQGEGDTIIMPLLLFIRPPLAFEIR
jgi:hypothetical protein